MGDRWRWFVGSRWVFGPSFLLAILLGFSFMFAGLAAMAAALYLSHSYPFHLFFPAGMGAVELGLWMLQWALGKPELPETEGRKVRHWLWEGLRKGFAALGVVILCVLNVAYGVSAILTIVEAPGMDHLAKAALYALGSYGLLATAIHLSSVFRPRRRSAIGKPSDDLAR